MKRKLTCIRCPLGCTMEAETEGESIISISGNRCKRGIEYAEKELFNPERIVTTTVSADDLQTKFLPVRTDRPVPRERVFEVLSEASAITARPPLRRGDVLIPSVAGTEANLIASKSL
jgi:CxxC motif-containing protein